MESVQCHIHKGTPVIPILSEINPIPCIDTYLFKIHSNIVLPSCLGLLKGLLPVGIPVKILKTVKVWYLLEKNVCIALEAC